MLPPTRAVDLWDIYWTYIHTGATVCSTPMGLLTAKLTAPQSKHIRFTQAQDKRLDDACTYLGCSLQSFISEATLERLAKVEAEQRSNKEHKAHKKETAKKREVRGLGLRTAQVETAIIDTPTPHTPQVVVNIPATTTAATTPTSDVSMLASYVTKGSILGRDMRLGRAREMLEATLDGDALDAAKKALDDAVAVLVAKSPSLSTPRVGGVLDIFK